VINTVRYCLFIDLHKKPIKKASIAKEVITSRYTKKDRHITATVWKEAKKTLSSVFGWDIVEMPKITKTGEILQSRTLILLATDQNLSAHRCHRALAELFACVVKEPVREYLEKVKAEMRPVLAEEQGWLMATIGYLFLCDGAEERTFDQIRLLGILIIGHLIDSRNPF